MIRPLRNLGHGVVALSRRSGLREGIGTIFDQGLYSLTSFLTGVLLARAMTQEHYGFYVLALSLIMAGVGIQRALISMPYTVHLTSHPEPSLPTRTGSAFVHQLALSGLSIAAGLVLLNLPGGQQLPQCTLVAVSLAIAGILARDFVRLYFLSTLQVRRCIAIGLSINVTQMTALSFLFFTDRLSLCSAFVVVGSCSLLGAFGFFLFKGARLSIARDAVVSDFIGNVRLGRWILGGNLVSTLSSQVYIWLLGIFADAKAIAVLGVVSSLANLLSPLLQGASAFLLPKMVQSLGTPSGAVTLERLLKRSTIALAGVSLAWLACAALLGEWLVTSIFSSKYAGYGRLLAILATYALVSAVSIPVTAALDALKRSDVSFRGSVAGLAVGVVLGAALVYEWGVYGAAVSALVANLVNLVYRWRGLKRLPGAAQSVLDRPA